MGGEEIRLFFAHHVLLHSMSLYLLCIVILSAAVFWIGFLLSRNKGRAAFLANSARVLLVVGAVCLAILMALPLQVYSSDAELATIGRIEYFGFPFPWRYRAPGGSSLELPGFFFNSLIWTFWFMVLAGFRKWRKLLLGGFFLSVFNMFFTPFILLLIVGMGIIPLARGVY